VSLNLARQHQKRGQAVTAHQQIIAAELNERLPGFGIQRHLAAECLRAPSYCPQHQAAGPSPGHPGLPASAPVTWRGGRERA